MQQKYEHIMQFYIIGINDSLIQICLWKTQWISYLFYNVVFSIIGKIDSNHRAYILHFCSCLFVLSCVLGWRLLTFIRNIIEKKVIIQINGFYHWNTFTVLLNIYCYRHAILKENRKVVWVKIWHFRLYV